MRLGLLVEQLLAPVPGGTGRYTHELAAALAATAAEYGPLGAALHSFAALRPRQELRRAAVPGVTGPHALPLPRRALVAAWERGLGPAVPCGRDGLVHAFTPLAPPRRGRPLVVTVHDAVPWTHPDTLTARGVAWHRRAVERAAREADLLVVPTQAVADELRHHVGRRGAVLADPDRVLVVGEGVSGALVAPPEPVLTERAAALGLPDRYLLTVATLEPRKGLAELVAALARPGAPALPLLCVGQPGWGGTDPRAVAASCGLGEGRVRVLGRVPDADLAVLLARATAVVVPSRAEGFGLPLLEAFAAGAPVVASRAAALVEVAGGAARHTDLDPDALALALREVVEDDALRDHLVAAGRARAAAFTWEGAATRLWAAYRTLL